MKKYWKRVAALCLTGVLSISALTTGDMKEVKAEQPPFDMSQSGTNGTEEWEKLRIDMGMPETNNAHGYRGTPLGNGLFAAKENGGVLEDVFALNHATFWSGDPAYRDYLYEGSGGYGNTQETRNGGYNELVETLKSAYTEGIDKAKRDALMQSINGKTQKMWEADLHSAFISAGRMKLSFPELTDTTDYQRILDLDTATSEISFKKGEVGYLRETFISNPDNTMVTRITNQANTPMGMSVSLEQDSNMAGKSANNKIEVDTEKNEIVMTGRAPYDFGATQWSEDRGTLLESRAKVILPKGGEINVEGSSLKVTGASEIIVLFTSETSFKDAFTDPANSGVDYAKKVRETMDRVAAKSYDEIKNAHLEEYRELFRRFWIDMGGSDIVTGNGTKVSPFEYARHYQYGRYINIACERANSLMPQGLLGMWSSSWKGPNEGAYFMNENMEKMQALKGAGNLQDSSDSQYNFISSWADERTGQRTAKTTYGAEDGAWMMSHSTGIWAKSGMWGGEVEYGSWLSGGIWALDSLYDKYDYTEDLKLLQKYYPLLEGAAKFALSTLIEVDGVNGELKGYKVVAPAGSPEHWYWVGDTKVAFDIATTSDTLLYYNLFNMMERGAKDLERAGIQYDKTLLNRVLEARSQMVPLEMFIDQDTGRLQEWYNEYPVGDERHRHASHLLGLFLGHININEADTPELYYAQQAEALRWINADGGTHPDRSLMAMRAGFEDVAFEKIVCGVIGTGYGHDVVMQWTAVASSIAESVVDSRFDQINLMENLPAAWSSGSVKGIRARGGYQLSLTWENGELLNCVIDSPTGETPRVLYRGNPVVLSEDSRFTVNRAKTTVDNLKYEAQGKLAGKYTKVSKAGLQHALLSEDYNTISNALLAMNPIHFVTHQVTMEMEKTVKVLTAKDQTLQLTAKSDKPDAQFKWSIEAADGGSAARIATVDDNGKVTAVGGGKVKVTAAIDGEPRSNASIELMVEAETTTVESIDDRDSRMDYSIGSWGKWEEGKHVNGTITYSMTTGSQATLGFAGDGIEFVGSRADHISDFKVSIDGKVVEEQVSGNGDRGFGVVMYSKMDLGKGDHSITIETLGNRFDIDAFNVYNKAASETNRKDLITAYHDAAKITDGDKYTAETWSAFQAAKEKALDVINKFDAAQADIDGAKETLTNANKALADKPVVRVTGVSVDKKTISFTKAQEKAQLKATVAPQNAANQKYSWKSLKPTIAAVDQNGQVTAVANGTTDIIVTTADGGKTAVCKVTVSIPAAVVRVTGVKLDKKSGTLSAKGAALKLKAAVSPSNAANRGVTWKSNNKKVAAVDGNGKVTAVGNGKTDIIVTTKDGLKTAKFTVTVKIVKKPGKATGLKLKERASTSVKVSWNKVKGADSYKVYIYRDNKKWKDYLTTKNASLTIKKLSAGSKYVVKVAAVNKGGTGTYSSSITALTEPAKTKLKSAKKDGTGKVKLSFNKVSGARYAIYRSSGKGKYQKVADTTKTSAVIKGLKKGKTYNFKVRTYIKSSGKNIYGSYSNVWKYKAK